MTAHTTDRRACPRAAASAYGIVSARVRPGYVVDVIDVSCGGALVEVARRLLPGSVVDLHVDTMGRRTTVRGRVARCTVSRLQANSVCYEAAIAFDHCLSGFLEGQASGYALPAVDGLPAQAARVTATQDVV
jgi:hypothetical protein